LHDRFDSEHDKRLIRDQLKKLREKLTDNQWEKTHQKLHYQHLN
jgi:hypothetical protein